MSFIRTLVFGLLLICAVGASEVNAQSLLSDVGSILTECVLPGGYVAGTQLRTFIRTNTWNTYRHSVSDTTAMNTLYEIAYGCTGANRTQALFACAVSVLDHRTIPIKLLFGITVDIPLTLESESNFERRVAHLPEHIYSDSIFDRDKLQHFFFSAYFNRLLGMNWATYTLGSLVEIGENAVVIGGMDDPRDRHANIDGARFGKCDDAVLPSTCVEPNP